MGAGGWGTSSFGTEGFGISGLWLRSGFVLFGGKEAGQAPTHCTATMLEVSMLEPQLSLK